MLHGPFRHLRHSKLIALAALAAFILGAMPRAGCICADGHYELFCQRRAAGANGAGCCSCYNSAKACCTDRSCCGQKEEASGDDQFPAGGVVSAQPCCHLVMNVPSVAMKELEKENGRRDPSPMGLATAEACFVPALPEAIQRAHLDQPIQPPIDLVIALKRLTI